MNADALRSSLKHVYYLAYDSKWSGGVVLRNSDRYCSVYKLQDKTKYGLTKTTLICTISHFNLGIEALFGGLSPQKNVATGLNFGAPVSLGGKLADICLISHIPVKRIQKILAMWLCSKLDLSVLTSEITGKESEKFLKNAKTKNLWKIKRILNTEIQANRGAHFLHLACQGGRRAPLPPVNYAAVYRGWSEQL